MLDQNILEALKQHFNTLTQTVRLRLYKSNHSKQTELKIMLEQLSSCSPKLLLEELDQSVDVVQFDVAVEEQKSGIRFRGIPGGHEFTSLVLAILNTDKQGKLPDQGIIKRISALQGPIYMSTYVSLSCENCPDIVQALNIMAIFNPSISHEMVDGGLFPDEVSALKLGGVPAVVIDGKLFHSGKGSLSELLEKLEEKYAPESDEKDQVNIGSYDVAVIGGGPAGASAAIYSARKGLKTVIIAEKMGGQVQETKGIENLVSVIYTEGPQLAANLEKHIEEYNIELLEHRRVAKIEGDEQKVISLSSGELVNASSIIVATGAKWRELNIPGEKEYLGRGVAYCPHCDGPYYKNKKVAVVGGGNSGVEAAIDLAGTCSEVVLFEFLHELKADQVLVRKLESLPNVKIILSAKADEVYGDGEKVSELRYIDRLTDEEKSEQLEAVFVQIGLSPNSKIGLEEIETNPAGEIVIDEKCRTNIKGVYAAGDVTTTPYKQIVISMGEGAKAALAAFEDQMLA